MRDLHSNVAEVLIDIERELRYLQLWDDTTIADEALASEQPFAVDTMTFPQWLQFIFIPRLYFMIERQMPLPKDCGIAPMAEHYFSALALPSAPLIAHLRRVDEMLDRR